MPRAAEVAASQDRCTAAWHEGPAPESAADSLWGRIELQHAQNFLLWHFEDAARLQNVKAEVIAEAKRAIDQVNQRRTDLIEEVDGLLLGELMKSNLPNPGAPLHSETPGQIVDRLSILSLKLYHTAEELRRENAPPGHRERNQARLEILKMQREDLGVCLDELWRAVQQGERRFKLYRQLKMYNDPELNPAIYGGTAKP